ncbi:glycosyl transferase group 1 [Cellulomonas flavigena DSM 20109]|uniref:Glycosyl transferase group 1 n=1 Tax=Cellulomonas flavigena (strain ATCC 482 / DSM 20109 / BCRC 11376 / JCM 18109 / NBRC 3775 / NCIMB 8073 / NRS 134) TaxID=446466 RepID=D5UHD3_CELFN|nr:glycosyl transferase group 1 [Cellulomonas flavigena DSM 20109]
MVVPCWADALPAARRTVRSALTVLPDAAVVVLDVDGCWTPLGREQVVTAAQVDLPDRDLHLRSLAVGTSAVARAVVADVVASRPDEVVLALEPGVELLRAPDELLRSARDAGVAVVGRTATTADPAGTWPTEADVAAHGPLHPALLAVHRPASAFLATWRASWRTPEIPWLDTAASRAGARLVGGPAVLLGPWNLLPGHTLDEDATGLRVDGVAVAALDLTLRDPARPWLLAAGIDRPSRARLSDHPALAARCARGAADETADPPAEPAWRASRIGEVPVDDVARGLVREAVLTGEHLPDPVTEPDAVLAWLTGPTAPGVPGRYLRALRESRPDLCEVFPGVPGEHTGPFLDWARAHGRHETRYSQELVDAAVAATGPVPAPPPPDAPRPPGVNVVGYLGGDIGIGESARLVLEALRAAGVPTRAVPVERHLQSRRRPYAEATGPAHGTTVVCVNADLTPSIARTVPHLLAGGARVGMWYWEVEEFPPELGASAALLDEVWVATDFVRAAVAPHVAVPVRVVTPPLPQVRATSVSRAELGLPADRPVVLFVFDYLSTVGRKNPLGAIEAFRRAFAPDEGPVLVLKSINGDRRHAEAERVRLRAAAEPDVVLLEDYLDAPARDALVASCDLYLSLHRAEGLGLTMAEAMAYGRPVVATRYGGNMQFMTDENSFLVPFSRVPVGPEDAPYPPGSPWAEPDLDAAAVLLRVLVEDPEEAARRGARAARDIAELWSPAAVAPRWADAVAGVHRRPDPEPEQRRVDWRHQLRRLSGGRV